MDKIRWGILGTGYIAGLFAEGLTALDDATLTAVGSRGQAGADMNGACDRAPRGHAREINDVTPVQLAEMRGPAGAIAQSHKMRHRHFDQIARGEISEAKAQDLRAEPIALAAGVIGDKAESAQGIEQPVGG